jgi:periplasmic protein TonB
MNSEKKEKEKYKVESFDDIIFKNRNKEYGAYYIRKTYHKALIPGIVFTILFPLLVFLFQLYLNYKYQSDGLDETTFYYDPTLIQQMDEFAYMQLLEPPKKSEQLKNEDEEKIDNKVPEVVDSVTKNQIEETDKNVKDTLGLKSDTTSVGREGFFDGTYEGNIPIYYQVDSLPQFPGGNVAMIRYIVNNIRYPEQAIKNNITGVVQVRFCIMNDGRIVKVELQKGVNPLLDAEAMRVVRSMPNWKPGKLKNKNVNVMFSLPINFNLRGRSQ